jgi:plastocyanin
VEDRVEEGRTPRRWLSALGLGCVLVMLIGALPRDGVSAAPPAAVATSTPTPTFSVVWRINDPKNGNRVWVDPFSQQFQFFPASDTPVAARQPTMRYSRQATTWNWSDTNRLCDATPVPPSTRVPRCPIFVWGSIDRVRHTARATLFKRNPNGRTSVYTVDQRLTPLALPMPDEPAVELQSGRFSPARITIKDDTLRVTFQNNTQELCTVVFDRSPNTSLVDPTSNRPLDQQTETIGRGRASTPFPRLQATPTPLPGEEAPVAPSVWIEGTHRYHCYEHPGWGGTIVVKTDG